TLPASGFEIRYLTNTTTRPRQAIVDRLTGMGFDLRAEHVFAPGIAAGRLLRTRKLTRIHLAAAPELADDFSDVELVEGDPEAIVLGDLYRAFDWD
ncbi:MAG: TIGR01458 family HAD-type hydrolase, partial [Alphaproteobacteria bacterium]|nr:TIGR01458 family HAD-type hydrolase [Alphaproteobacteria bacterium]